MGSSSGKNRRAKLRLITATGADFGELSCSVKVRPRSSGMESVSKYPGSATAVIAPGKLSGESEWPRIVKLAQELAGQLRGRGWPLLTRSTPGSADNSGRSF